MMRLCYRRCSAESLLAFHRTHFSSDTNLSQMLVLIATFLLHEIFAIATRTLVRRPTGMQRLVDKRTTSNCVKRLPAARTSQTWLSACRGLSSRIAFSQIDTQFFAPTVCVDQKLCSKIAIRLQVVTTVHPQRT